MDNQKSDPGDRGETGASPHWLTGDGLNELRRLKGSSPDDRRLITKEFWDLDQFDAQYNCGPRGDIGKDYWVGTDVDVTGCWLTEVGHEALAAIEAEEIHLATLAGTVAKPKGIHSLVAHVKGSGADTGWTGDEEARQVGLKYQAASDGVERQGIFLDLLLLFRRRQRMDASAAGWTKDWPTELGWWWVFADGKVRRIEMVWHVDHGMVGELGGCLQAEKDNPGTLWHAMEQPPEPPKATP